MRNITHNVVLVKSLVRRISVILVSGQFLVGPLVTKSAGRYSKGGDGLMVGVYRAKWLFFCEKIIMRHVIVITLIMFAVTSAPRVALAEGNDLPAKADLVLHHGKVVTVDPQFHIAEAVAIRGDRIMAVGSNGRVLELAGPRTRRIDLGGKTVLPGLLDSHLHLMSSAMYEFDHAVPEMETIADVLSFIRARAALVKPGDWIMVQQVFITRLRDRRFPTRQELDEAASHNPVAFCTGPDASLNSLALKRCGIDKDFEIRDGLSGRVERDPASREPTGILRNSLRLVKWTDPTKAPSDSDRRRRLRELLAAYNEVGITSVSDRDTPEDEIETIRAVHDRGELTCRVFLTYRVNAQSSWEKTLEQLNCAARHPLRHRDDMLWLHGVKIYLDGGMLTGSAYMLKPWGSSKIYSITDPNYRGLRFIEPERLYQIARWTLGHDLQLTAHAVGDGAVSALVDAYERVDRELPVRPLRPCISHANFMTAEVIGKMARLGIVADMQPVWLYLDGSTLREQFGDARLAWFQPYKSLFDRGVMVGGGSDHMQKLGRRRSINPYDPFLGIWTMLVRQPRWADKPLHPEQCISREDAIRFYTIRNAFLTFAEREKGSLEPGKLADLIVLDKDILTCPVDEVKDIRVRTTYLGGKVVYRVGDATSGGGR
jgi:predicted amidohydrolase YtcJ